MGDSFETQFVIRDEDHKQLKILGGNYIYTFNLLKNTKNDENLINVIMKMQASTKDDEPEYLVAQMNPQKFN